MTTTCCLDCATTPKECGDVNCRTEPKVAWCKQKPNERNSDTEYPKTNKDLCNGNCKRFIPKSEETSIEQQVQGG